MTVDQCINVYDEVAKRIFDTSLADKLTHWFSTGATYHGSTLEEVVKEKVKQYGGGDAEAKMLDPNVAKAANA